MADVKKLAEELVGLTILEAKELNDILKDEYGIEPAAAAVMAGPAGGDAGGAAEAKTDFDVVMTSFGGNKIAVIKEVRAITGLGLKEAKELVEGAPKAVKEAVPEAEANDIKEKLEAAGASVELK
ncbi:50S ribosomal protein L7/L12 [uncultured Algimonas sp.]|uniref:50S ribosomal protein L7/L12 n=1 Tax=uncultured Algimonas sp. TaxID=1547920 RepID=UPI002623D634|nr:50S ribosomal protein L7/L12 [uncultured Algimonas sp.]